MSTLTVLVSQHSETELRPRHLEALARLNEIGAAINSISAGDVASVGETLHLIADSASEVILGASAVIYGFDAESRDFDTGLRVASGRSDASFLEDEPRQQGMGRRAIDEQRCVLSYEESDLVVHEARARVGALVVVCYPLIVSEQPVGVLYLYLHEERRFAALELLMLENFVNLAAITLFHAARLEAVKRDLERKEAELARLRRADVLISSRPRLEETLEAILQMALEVTDARYGIFRLVDRATGLLVTRAIAGEDLGQPAVEALPINTTSVTGWVAKNRIPLRIADVHADRWSRIYYPFDHVLPMRSELAVPLLGSGGRLEGVINLESPRAGAFSEEDSLLLQSLATQAVIAIQEVRLLDALQEVAERLLSDSAQQVFDRLVDLTCDLLDAPASALWTLEGEELLLRSASGGYRRGARVPLAQSLTGAAILSHSFVYSDDVRSDPRFRHPELAAKQGWSQALVVPLAASQESDPVGALSIYGVDSETGRLVISDWDRKVLIFIAHHAALAVQNAERQQALRRAQEQHAAAETFAAVGDIAANLLHRLNNKIGAIPVRVEGIQDKCQASLQSDAYLAHNLAEIERSAIEAMEALGDSLFYLRPIHLSPVDVAISVEQAIAAVDVPETVTVHVSGLSDLPDVMAGSQRLALVIVNLLENAITAMMGTGEIDIEGCRQNGWVEISVTDTGPGVDPSQHERIFEFNYSGASASSGKLGFGLWWVKTLIARFAGSITVESDGSHGTTFRLNLPIAGSDGGQSTT